MKKRFVPFLRAALSAMVAIGSIGYAFPETPEPRITFTSAILPRGTDVSVGGQASRAVVRAFLQKYPPSTILSRSSCRPSAARRWTPRR